MKAMTLGGYQFGIEVNSDRALVLSGRDEHGGQRIQGRGYGLTPVGRPPQPLARSRWAMLAMT